MNLPASPAQPAVSSGRWYQGVTRAQWLVLSIACAVWICDAYDSQIFNVTRSYILADVMHLAEGDPTIRLWGDIFLGISLIGGAIGGTLFGSLSDRIGRRPAMIGTILMFTIFSGLTAFAQSGWQVATLRFFLAMGTAGAWVVGASYISDVFSPQARAQAGAIFHSTSNIGTGLASLIGIAVGANWRYAYILGVLPIFLIIWVRSSAQESPRWKEVAARVDGPPRGSIKELLFGRPWGRRALLGMFLASVGIGTYWCITVGGQDLVQDFLVRRGIPSLTAHSRAQFAYGFLINGGGFIGALAFGPIAHWLGRRKAFAFAMLGGAMTVPITWYLPQTYGQLLVVLPFFGFFTFGFHSGFAFYLPELFPTQLRGVGAGFCFNGGRVLAAVALVFSGWLKSRPGFELRDATSLLALLYLIGLLCVWFLPETKGENIAKIS